MIETVGNWFLIGGAAGVVYFTVRYGTASRWWSYPEGRALFAKSASLALLSCLGSAYAIFGDYPYRLIVRLIVMVLFCFAAWWLVGVLEKRLRADRRERDRLLCEYMTARKREEEAAAQLPPVPAVIERAHRWRQITRKLTRRA